MGNIVLLDELTINQIAAGEVIERPASVIKEMIENSIDAGAKNVTVEIKNGGISFIRVTDNGKGIEKDDVELAFERHATSKIRSSEDLNTVKSMGFRGEALASIAAISNIELVSKTQNDEIGTRIVVQGGEKLEHGEIACSKGTTITVRNLFYNTPVRYKFLKKDFTEAGYIEDVVTRIALIHPEVSIKFINSGKTILKTNGNGDLIQVIYTIFGKEVTSNLIKVNYEYEYMKIRGVIGHPNIARSNRSNQIFYVNKRYIKDKTLSSAVEQAFKGLLPIGKFAFLVLNVEMPSSKVDVNVHPAKLEVRFEDENIVFQAIYHSIKDTLLKTGFLTNREKNIEIKEAKKDAFKINNIEEKINHVYSTQGIKEIATNNIENTQRINVKKEKNTIPNVAYTKDNTDFLEKLKTIQQTLKEEIQQNPNIQLTDNYKKMEKEYNALVQSKKESVKILEKDLKDTKNIPIPNEEGKLESTQNIPIPNEEGKLESTQNIPILNEESDLEDTKTNEEINFKDEKEKNFNNEEVNSKKSDMPSFEEMYKQLFGKEPYSATKKIEEENKSKEKDNFYVFDTDMQDANVSLFEDMGKFEPLKYKFIGIAFNTYIILEIENELYIMDQHAAHERVMYEKVKKNFFENREKDSQLLLLPDIITLTHKEMDIAKDNLYLFRKSGFIIDEFGENTLKISGVPEICLDLDLDTKELFIETLDQVNTIARTAKQEKEEKFLATIACKAAVKANMVLSEQEVDNLMQELLKLPNPFTCPHGRPTVIKMSKYEIERKFARK